MGLSCVVTGLTALPIYAAYAANGGSYEGDGAAKAATLVAVTAVMGGIFTTVRSRSGPAGVVFYLMSERGGGGGGVLPWGGGAVAAAAAAAVTAVAAAPLPAGRCRGQERPQLTRATACLQTS